MVEIEEERSDSQSTSQGSASEATYRDSPLSAMLNHMKEKHVESVLLILRLLTVVFSLLYVFPFAMHPSSAYSKVLLCAAGTNLFRLRQRMGGFHFSREFLSRVFTEDACHYLFYSLMFLGMHSVTMALLPVFLFAFLHASSFIIQLLNVGGLSGTAFWRALNNIVNGYSNNLLMLIACCEIFLMPTIIVMIFFGKSNIFMPFVYYRFLTLRYLSRRNPNTRIAFNQMRLALEQSVERPSCPAVFRNAVYKFTAFVSRLSPGQT